MLASDKKSRRKHTKLLIKHVMLMMVNLEQRPSKFQMTLKPLIFGLILLSLPQSGTCHASSLSSFIIPNLDGPM